MKKVDNLICHADQIKKIAKDANGNENYVHTLINLIQRASLNWAGIASVANFQKHFKLPTSRNQNQFNQRYL
jgi:hypothetical protein